MSVIALSLAHLLLSLAAVTAVWLWQLRSRNAGIIDAAWPMLIGAGGVMYAAAGSGDLPLRVLVGLLAAAWALRLGGYLAVRNRGPVEERRYAELRAGWGAAADHRMLWFFWFQAVVAWLMALSFAPLAYRPEMPGMAWLVAGALVGGIGIIGETVADAQLRTFRADRRLRGYVCDHGLWRYSRHPNYFFECVHWAGYPLLAVGASWGWLSWTGLVLISFLLLKVSGIPTVEGREARGRRIGFDEYVRRTSAFIPWPPRKES